MAIKTRVVTLPADLVAAIQRVATERPEEFIAEAVKRELVQRN